MEVDTWIPPTQSSSFPPVCVHSKFYTQGWGDNCILLNKTGYLTVVSEMSSPNSADLSTPWHSVLLLKEAMSFVLNFAYPPHPQNRDCSPPEPEREFDDGNLLSGVYILEKSHFPLF